MLQVFFYIFSYMMLFFRTLTKFIKIYCLFETSLVHTYYFLKVKDMIFFGSASIIFLYYNHHWLDWCVDGRGDTLLHGSFVHSAFIIAHHSELMIAQKGCNLGKWQWLKLTYFFYIFSNILTRRSSNGFVVMYVLVMN